jgi:hypothetical protein
MPSGPDARRKPSRFALSPIREFFRAFVGAFQGRTLVSRSAVGLLGCEKALLKSYFREESVRWLWRRAGTRIDRRRHVPFMRMENFQCS